MKKTSAEEILFGYQSPINLSTSDEKYFKPLWHFHSEYELVYIQKSFGKRFIGDHVGNFKAGDLYFIGKQLPHMWVNDNLFFTDSNKLTASSMVLHFNLDFFSKDFLKSDFCSELGNLLEKSNLGIQIKGEAKQRVLEKINEIKSKKGLELYAALINILQILIDAKKYKTLSSSGYVNAFIHSNSKRINTINEYIVNNFRNTISLSDVADLASMNVTSFCRYFKMKTNQPFNQYLISFRIGHAKRLLIHTDLSVSQICFEIGFNNLANFNRHFKKITLLTPKDFRKKQMN